VSGHIPHHAGRGHDQQNAQKSILSPRASINPTQTQNIQGTDGNNSTEWFIFVTHWTAALMGGYAWAAFASTLLPTVRWLDAAAWFLHGVAAPLTVMVTVLYWA
jgi:hypothetical protein